MPDRASGLAMHSRNAVLEWSIAWLFAQHVSHRPRPCDFFGARNGERSAHSMDCSVVPLFVSRSSEHGPGRIDCSKRSRTVEWASFVIGVVVLECVGASPREGSWQAQKPTVMAFVVLGVICFGPPLGPGRIAPGAHSHLASIRPALGQ